jgi:hypothetical protein
MDMEEGPFRYHLELTPEQLKITHTALRSLLDDFGHEQADLQALIHEVLAKLPDDHAIRAIRIGGESPEAAADVVELTTPEQRNDGDDPIDPISA